MLFHIDRCKTTKASYISKNCNKNNVKTDNRVVNIVFYLCELELMNYLSVSLDRL